MTQAATAAWHARNARSHHVLNAAQVEAFDRLGYHFPLRAFSPAEIESYRDKLERFEKANGGTLGGQLRNKPHLLFTWADEIIRHPAILDASPRTRATPATSPGTRTPPTGACRSRTS
jgi:hypothetical protein